MSTRPPSRNIAYRRVRRPDPALIARAARLAVSDLYESLAPDVRDTAVMSARMRPLLFGLRIAGPAVTARNAARDNLMMHKALQLAQSGDVLVVASDGPSGAQWGYLAAVYAERINLAGVIVDGCIRDADALVERRFPVWSTAIAPSHPDKRGAGAVNVPVACDGVLVHPGDIICADGDGVLVVRPQHLAAAVEGAERRAQHEADAVAAIGRGQSVFDIHGLERPFAESGVREIDAAWDDEQRTPPPRK